MNDLAEILNVIGPAVYFPCEGKKPSKLVRWGKWGSYTPEEMTRAHFHLVGEPRFNVGVVLGRKSNGLVVVDIDDDDFVEPFKQLNPWTANTLITRGSRGASFWVRINGAYPKSGSLNGVKGEFKANGTYAIVAGNNHPDTKQPWQWLSSNPVTTIHFEDIKWPKELEKPSPSSRHKESSITHLIVNTASAVEESLPKTRSANHDSLFRLSRGTKYNLAYHLRRAVTKSEYDEAFERWFNKVDALGFIRETKKDYRKEFWNWVRAVKYPLGRHPVKAAWERAKVEPPPEAADAYKGKRYSYTRSLIALCWQMEQGCGDRPWWISCRDGAKVLGGMPQNFAKRLQVVIADGVVEVVAPAKEFGMSPHLRWKTKKTEETPPIPYTLFTSTEGSNGSKATPKKSNAAIARRLPRPGPGKVNVHKPYRDRLGTVLDASSVTS